MNNHRGFSIAELLVAILILSLVSTVVAGGIPVARDAYEKITLSANAQTMLSTAISALRNELCTASDVSVENDKITLRYYSSSIQNYSVITIASDSNNQDYTGRSVVIQQYADSSSPASSFLVSASAGDNELYVRYDSVSYDETTGIITFVNLRVVDEDDTVRAKLKTDSNDASYYLVKVIKAS